MSGARPVAPTAPAPDLSVVVPLYNEEESVRRLYERIRGACDKLGRTFEILFVDDGSGDRTWAIVKELRAADPRLRAIRFRKNYGQTPAMAAGFAHARGEIIVSMDGDLQNDPADIPRLLQKMEEGFDVVCGWRKNRQDKFLTRRVPSMVANWIIGRVTGVPIRDNGCSLKAYRGSVIKSVTLYGEMHRFIPAMSTLAGARIAEIVVNHHARMFGTSKYGLGRVWRVFMDIITIKMIIGFAMKPLRWFAALSLPLIVAGSALLVAAGALFLGRATSAWIVSATVALLLLFLGAHLVSLGIIGELVTHTGDFRLRRTVRATAGPLETTHGRRKDDR